MRDAPPLFSLPVRRTPLPFGKIHDRLRTSPDREPRQNTPPPPAFARPKEIPSPKDIPLLKALAEKGDAKAQYNLGGMYLRGEGVEKDLKEGIKWYRKAAEQNYALAQYGLGWMYQYGQGVEKDIKEAVKWYRKAAEQNHPDAQYNLGVMYDNGEGVGEDDKEAVKWYRKAAGQNFEPAKAALKKLSEQQKPKK